MESKKIKVPRKLKKRIKKSRMVFDLATLPANMTIERLLYIYKTTGWVFYEGTPPKFY